ncbi:hypothetical protein FDI85_gp011 [Erwinia phage Machina]|jgi:hypothetical protein|uniref:Uncharacterized protein n=2 Tax=Machinavirus machina TaxID=2169990 RepID=A0A1B2IDR3_9CAUD|nr:hypothetical protein BIZ81_gp011 [Erwinia phage vB_EamM_Huxley]YP_009617190.1 hypothetical protein FDI85_gp011 [Erwinia phage Machina]ANZ50182.1 hypothetical protein PARSHIK_273 [Erwinia phage vB_EamM_Parshik]QOC54724.1 hypothetical protein pSALSNUABM04_264 [Salmonella phage pSal-SNUABM-04]QQO90759.1 hypothetical protein pEaSNUABM43_00275 [Erwinia phage pEa_SNUABM_43]QVW55591.1 hypothetical protein pEaSNUABM42_00274 [Erwinia phage pEa_SNUABM_42]QVW56140.1 hypothetical protein pEaSNUABM10_0
MTQLFYLAVAIVWIAMFVSIHHIHGVVKQHAIQNNLSTMVLLRSQAFAITGMIVLGAIATSGMHYVYTLHQLSVL